MNTLEIILVVGIAIDIPLLISTLLLTQEKHRGHKTLQGIIGVVVAPSTFAGLFLWTDPRTHTAAMGAVAYLALFNLVLGFCVLAMSLLGLLLHSPLEEH